MTPPSPAPTVTGEAKPNDAVMVSLAGQFLALVGLTRAYDHWLATGGELPNPPWLGIESAPEDGTDIDLWIAPLTEDGYPLTPCRVPNAFWDDGSWYWRTSNGTNIRIWHRATHWMPQPAGPNMRLTQPTPSLQPDPGANESQAEVVVTGQIDIDQLFSGHGVAVRAKDDPPIPGEPFMSIALAKLLARSALRQQAAEIEALRLSNAITKGFLESEIERSAEEQARATKAEAENARLREALEKIEDLPGEINPSNYDHDDVCYLNAQFIEAYNIARQAREAQGA